MDERLEFLFEECQQRIRSIKTLEKRFKEAGNEDGARHMVERIQEMERFLDTIALAMM